MMWLHVVLGGGGGGGTITTVSGVSPLSLVNAVAGRLSKLIRYGKVNQTSGGIVCNNGTLVLVDDELPRGYKRIESIDFDGNFRYETGEVLMGTDDVTLTLSNTATSGQNVFGSYNGSGSGTKNFSLYLYGNGSSSNCYFRYGGQLVRPRYGSGTRTLTFGASGTSGFLNDVTVTPDEFTTVASAYIGMLPNSTSSAYSGTIEGNILVSNRLKYIPCERVLDGVIGYYEVVKGTFLEPVGTGTPVKGEYDNSHCTVIEIDGTAEVLTVGGQSASVQNLFAVGDVKDEQDIISGVVTRRTELVASNGTITIQALANPVTERVTQQPITLAEGTNVITSSFTGAEISATYKKAT